MRIARLLAGLALILATGGPLTAAEKSADGFVPLFNGKDLSGWVPVNVHPGTFFVKDGEIVTTGKPTGYMRSEKQYENFVLEMEWMHVNTEAMGNSGLFVWGDVLPVPGSPFTRGVEVQVLVNLTYKDKQGRVTASSHGDVFSIQGATCKPDRPHPTGGMRCIPSEFRAKGGGEWNHYKVTAKDGTIKLEVNGKEVSGVSEVRPHRKGYLALESEGAECHFRNIKIKELPSTNPKPEEVGPVAQGHVNLLTGIDLLNWKADADQKAHWKFQDYRLVYDGRGDAASRTLRTEKEYADFELIADWRVPAAKGKQAPAATAGLALRSSDKGQVRITVSPTGGLEVRSASDAGEGGFGNVVPAVKAPGSWNRAEVVMKGNRLSLRVNGKDVVTNAEQHTAAPRGPIALIAEGGPVEFANVFVRELKRE